MDFKVIPVFLIYVMAKNKKNSPPLLEFQNFFGNSNQDSQIC